MKFRNRKTFLCVLLLIATASIAFANGNTESRSFPDRQLQVIFPWDPAGAYAVSQVVANRMAEDLGKPMVVTSTVGAGGVKAALTVMNKPADGYTIFDAYVAPLILAPLFDRAEYTYEDWEPLYAVASNAFAVASRPDETRWNDLPSLLKYAQDHPGELRYSAGGEISLPHMVAASMLKQGNAVCRAVPYGDTATSWKDFASGELDFMVINSGVFKTYENQLNVLAVLSDTPVGDGGIPGPLASEFGIDLGVHGLASTGWTWWVVKKGTPADHVDALRQAMYAAMSDEKVKSQISGLGFTALDPEIYSPENYDEKVSQFREELGAALGAIDWEKEQLLEL